MNNTNAQLVVSPRHRSGQGESIAPPQIQYLHHMRAIRERRRGRPSPLSGFERHIVLRQIRLFHCGAGCDAIASPSEFESAQHACVGRWLGLSQVVRGLGLSAFRALSGLQLEGPALTEDQHSGGYVVAANDACISAHALWWDRSLAARLLTSYFDSANAEREGQSAEFARAKQECAWHALIAAHNTSTLSYEAYCRACQEELAANDASTLPIGQPDVHEPEAPACFPISGFDLLAA